MIDSIFELLKSWFYWLIKLIRDWLTELLEPVWGALEDIIPDDLGEIWDEIMPMISAVNAWIPLDLGLTLVVAYYTFLCALIVWRWVKGFIPGFSGRA